MARVGRATDGGSGNSGGSVNGAPARKRLSTGNTGSAGRAGQVRKEIRRLTQLEEVWWPVALEGNKEATDRVLAIQKQRLSCCSNWRTLRMRRKPRQTGIRDRWKRALCLWTTGGR